MNKYTETFVKYCKEHLDFNKQVKFNYKSLAVCVIDCVYSLNARDKCRENVVDFYAKKYLDDDINSSKDRLKDLIQHIEDAGGPEAFAKTILNNKQQSGRVAKGEVCLQLAKYLRCLGIDTIADFHNYEYPQLLEAVIKAVKGIGDAGTNYLFMLTGDQDRCKQDTHIRQFVKKACGDDLSNDEIQELFTDAVKSLHSDYPDLTVAMLDGIIWRRGIRR